MEALYALICRVSMKEYNQLMFRKLFGRTASSVKAVYEQDIASYLESLGVLEKVKEGKAKCMHCGQIITLENLDAIVPKKGEISFICWNQECIGQEI